MKNEERYLGIPSEMLVRRRKASKAADVHPWSLSGANMVICQPQAKCQSEDTGPPKRLS
jgi:hypothetical protein